MERYTIVEGELDGRTVWRVRDNEECRITMGYYRTEADAQYSIDYAFSDRPDPRDQRIAELEAALRPFAKMADTWTVQNAAKLEKLLTITNGERMCGIDAKAFIAARDALQ